MPSMNNLQILGQIDVQQFWPTGSSDADTTKLMVQVAPGSFRIKLAGSSTHEPTNAYEKAFMYGEKNKQGVRKKERLINSKGQITVRLQRVDAPELHINPGPIKGKSLKGTGLFVEYRQRQAETGTVALPARGHWPGRGGGQIRPLCRRHHDWQRHQARQPQLMVA
jgi:hypothetical protein